MTNLSVNLNKIALIRNQRDVGYPDPIAAGRTILKAGANGLTIHPRPDGRHIKSHDAYGLAKMMEEDDWFKQGREFNIEGYPSPEFMALILEIKPDQVTFVPDSPDARTSDHGWQLQSPSKDLINAISQMKGSDIRISLFMDAEESSVKMIEQIKAAYELGANAIELYTEPFAVAFQQNDSSAQLNHCLETFAFAANKIKEAGLRVNAGHDLSLENLPSFRNAMPFLDEVSIGHAFTSDALWLGFDASVIAYKKALMKA